MGDTVDKGMKQLLVKKRECLNGGVSPVAESGGGVKGWWFGSVKTGHQSPVGKA
jgi:hypothetical protein